MRSYKVGDSQKEHGDGGNKERPEQRQAVSRAATCPRCQIQPEGMIKVNDLKKK